MLLLVWITIIGVLTVIALASSLVTRKQRKLYRRQPPDGIARIDPGRERIDLDTGESQSALNNYE